MYKRQVHAGDIAAALGLKDTFTGETLAEQHRPIVLEEIHLSLIHI